MNGAGAPARGVSPAGSSGGAEVESPPLGPKLTRSEFTSGPEVNSLPDSEPKAVSLLAFFWPRGGPLSGTESGFTSGRKMANEGGSCQRLRWRSPLDMMRGSRGMKGTGTASIRRGSCRPITSALARRRQWIRPTWASRTSRRVIWQSCTRRPLRTAWSRTRSVSIGRTRPRRPSTQSWQSTAQVSSCSLRSPGQRSTRPQTAGQSRAGFHSLARAASCIPASPLRVSSQLSAISFQLSARPSGRPSGAASAARTKSRSRS